MIDSCAINGKLLVYPEIAIKVLHQIQCHSTERLPARTKDLNQRMFVDISVGGARRARKVELLKSQLPVLGF